MGVRAAVDGGRHRDLRCRRDGESRPRHGGYRRLRYDDSDEAYTEQWLDPGAHRAAAEALARWAAASTETRPSSDAIVAALADLEDAELGAELGERHILFAEDGLRAVLQDLLGLPLDRAVFAA